MPQTTETCDIAVIGAGAAGLMAAIQAGRAGGRGIVVLEGARTLGAKILVAGGGRCNVTHHEVSALSFAGSTAPAIRKVLLRFDVPETIAFFRELGVELKREETGKLFPTTDRARTVLDALVGECRRVGAELRHPWRVDRIRPTDAGFRIDGVPRPEAGASPPRLNARRVILATGGKSLPKSGSDGHGYTIVQSLGHTLTPRLLPGLVPLRLPTGHFLTRLSGLSIPAELELHGGSGKRLHRLAGAVLCTHFGLSGPGIMDMSRYYLDARETDAGAVLSLNLLPGKTSGQVDGELMALGARTLLRWLRESLPERLTRALIESTGLDPATPGHALTRVERRALAAALTGLPLPITGHRGFNFAEVTAGGVPLRELHLKTLESRVTPGLFLCGEICDVDGRIGGFNFQWAWASGTVAGRAAAQDPELDILEE